VQRDPGRHVADRAEPEDEQGAALGHVGVDHRLPGGRQHVGEEQEPLVGGTLGHLDRHELRLRDPQELGLRAGHLAVELAEPEQRGAHSLVAALGGLALGVEPALAHPAGAAADLEGHHHPVAHLEVVDARADLLHDAHRLVAEDVALPHERAEGLVEVQVRAAQPAGGDPDDRVVRLLEDRVRDLFHPNVSPTVPSDCLHRVRPPRCRDSRGERRAVPDRAGRNI
jgi:hypothetical protein